MQGCPLPLQGWDFSPLVGCFEGAVHESQNSISKKIFFLFGG